MKQPNPDVLALAEEYSAKIKSLSENHESQMQSLYQEYIAKHQCLMKRKAGVRDDTRNDYQTLLISSGQTQEQVLYSSSQETE
jgi:hypothetical protein